MSLLMGLITGYLDDRNKIERHYVIDENNNVLGAFNSKYGAENYISTIGKRLNNKGLTVVREEDFRFYHYDDESGTHDEY